jgi:chromosomal replication initiator protein
MRYTPEEIWAQCLSFIKNNIGELPYNTWFRHIGFYSFDGNNLRLDVPNRFFVEYIESNYLELLRVTIRKFYGDVKLGYHIEVDRKNDLAIDEDSTDSSSADTINDNHKQSGYTPENVIQDASSNFDSNLNPNCTFENFIKGDSNKLPAVIAEAIAQKYQNTFNPFFVYGASGVGKSHLINAIGIKVKELHPHKRIIYVSAHLFQIQYVESVKKNHFNDFMNFYQSIDVLIIDDIQEIAGKTGTQEAFFNIFNHLHRNQKQIILACDRPPVSLSGLQDRLLSRFKWGMIAELESPDYNLRRDILNFKIQHEGLSIPSSLVDYIAENVTGSVRDLEGIINSIMAYSIATNADINMDLVESVISKVVSTRRKVVTIDDILNKVCKKYAVKSTDLVSSSRKQNIVHVRQIIMYLSQKCTDLSTTQIGLRIGRDHATVIHSCSLVKKRMGSDAVFKREMDVLEHEIYK